MNVSRTLPRIPYYVMAGLLVSAVAPPATAEIVSRTFFDPTEQLWGIYEEAVGTNLFGGRVAHPSRWIDFDNDGVPELEIRGPRTGESGSASININTSAHVQLMAADKVTLDKGGWVLPVPQNVSIGSDAASHLYGGLPDVGWHHHWDFGYYPPNPFFVDEEDYYPSLLVTSGGRTAGIGQNESGGYFGAFAGTPPFDELLYIGFRFGEEGSWNYGWLHISILGGWEGWVSGWAYETELNKPILAGAIPEPASAVLLAGAFALTVIGARRRQRHINPPCP